MATVNGKLKCRDYNACRLNCLRCDLHGDRGCNKSFFFDVPIKPVEVQRGDHIRSSWHACPTCGSAIGYHPKDKNYRCVLCNQRIEW